MGWQVEPFLGGSLESGVAGWRVPPAPDLRPTPRARTGQRRRPGPGSGGAAALAPSRGRAAREVGGERSRPRAPEGVVREAGRARASTDRDGLESAPAARAESLLPCRVPRPRAGLPTPPHAFPGPTVSDRLPPRGDVSGGRRRGGAPLA